jgi:hypothetical protein
MSRLIFPVVLILAATASAAVPPEVDGAVRGVSDYYNTVQAFRAEVRTTVGTVPSGGRQPIVSRYAVILKRPNLASFAFLDGNPSPTYVSDGKTFTTYMPVLHQYKVDPAPREIDGIFQHSRINALSMGCLFARILMVRNPYAGFMKDVKSGRLLKAETVSGVRCRRVKLVREGSDVDLWIAEGKKPLVYRVVTVGTRKPPPGRKALQPRFEVVFAKWELAPDIPGQAFTFKPPEDAKQVDKFTTGSPQDSVGLKKKKK